MPSLTINLSHFDAAIRTSHRGLVEAGRSAEAAGADQVMLTDHVVLGTNLDSHAALGGPFPWPPQHPYPDPFVVLSAIAAVTTRIRLSTGLLIAPLRPAVLLAKLAATLDDLSQGRLDLGVGTGWQIEEFDALGVPFEGKAQRMDDAIGACRALWAGGPASFTSPTVSFRDLYCVPRPAATEGIPVWFGGGARRAVARRVARLGSGWLPLGAGDTESLTRGRRLLTEEFEAHGRDPATAGIRIALPTRRDSAGRADLDRTLGAVADYQGLGVTAVSLTLGDFVSDPADTADVLARARALVPVD